MHHIVIFGPPLAGKHSMLKAIASMESASPKRTNIERAGEPAHIGIAVEMSGGIVVTTIPGAVWSLDVWVELLPSTPCSVILVMDSLAERTSVNREHATWLERRDVTATCIAWTKSDLVQTGASATSPDVVSGSARERWPSFVTRLDQPSSVIAPYLWLRHKVSVASSAL